MVTFNKIESEYRQLLLNDFSSEELTEYYKVLNSKFISTIGTIDNNFSYDKQEQEKLKNIIEELNYTLNSKYNAKEVDVATKYNAVLKEYLKLQSEFILKEVYSSYSFVLNINQTIYRNIKNIEYILIDLGFSYYANELPSNIGFLNSVIQLSKEEIEFNINFFNNLTLNCLTNSSVYSEELEPMKDLIKSTLAETEEHISYYEHLIANPFEKVIELELKTIEDIYSGSSMQEEKEQLLNNVPEYDFTNYELILPKGSVN